MKAQMSFGEITVEVEGDAKECFTDIAKAAEVFGQTKCGACGSEHVTPVVRDIEGNTYYEMRCNECGHVLGFGQRRQDGALFPRRKKGDEWLPKRGWIDPRQKAAASSDDSPF
jgi:DNA-directed RNA polymerase subunit RPC12/RpoP